MEGFQILFLLFMVAVGGTPGSARCEAQGQAMRTAVTEAGGAQLREVRRCGGDSQAVCWLDICHLERQSSVEKMLPS